MPSKMSPEQRFEALVDALSGDPAVTPPGSGAGARFGSSALKVDNKIFAMLVAHRLVVKLPRSRVDALVDAGNGERFDAGKGTPMKEWLSVGPATADWLSLAREALAFVGRRA